jgi:hypothetical protein
MKKILLFLLILAAIITIYVVVRQNYVLRDKEKQEEFDGDVLYTPSVMNERPDYPYPLDNPPAFHYKLLDFGERPCWSPDGKRIAFVESNDGDICEVDIKTRKVRNLTKDLGVHHSFLRVHYLPAGDYILIGPAEFKNRNRSRRFESELWFMDKDASEPPKPLGRRIFEGCATSRIANRISYSVSGQQDSLVGRADQYEIRVADIEITGKNARLVNERVVYRAEHGFEPESQDFRFNDSEIIIAEYYSPKWGIPRIEPDYCTTKGIQIEIGEVKLYIYEPGTHNECEGIFPNNENYICLESSAHNEVDSNMPTDVWKMKLDGSGERVRITRMVERKPWRSSNPVVSLDGKWLAFMVNLHTSEAGYGMGMGLFDLEAWEKSEYSKQWEVPENMK